MDPSRVDPDPIKQFDHWFNQAQDSGIPEPNAMSLSTSGADHQPSSRMVLLKAYDQKGFVFYTNYGSRKGEQIQENPKVAALFPWVALARQIHIEGEIEKISQAESLKYFATRPYGSQLGAWVSNQSSVIKTRSLLEQKWEEMKSKFNEGKVPLPDNWGGIRIIPNRIEFWQGQESRLHDRVLYEKENGSWKISRLSP